MKSYIIGTMIMIIVGVMVATYFFEKHPELTSPRQNQPIEKQEAKGSEPPQLSPLRPFLKMIQLVTRYKTTNYKLPSIKEVIGF
ncbi:C4-dicarboxylate transporter [Bacillus niacini]|uniref:C4-dicarboxylate transporter n=1 Tax=Neobacillus niacini TaxID=86668 RepID=A0A852T6E5_9BACI|nr:hypothetical protein [Neobacillus niacini]NYE04312.1 C4-dicarboxylate transporter [Neobacillus niacini]